MAEPAPQPDPHTEQGDGDVRYLPVPVERAPLRAQPVRGLDRPAPPLALVAAAGGFLAGVATFVLVRVLRHGRGAGALARGLGGRRRGRTIEVAGTRSFLVDVHLLKR